MAGPRNKLKVNSFIHSFFSGLCKKCVTELRKDLCSVDINFVKEIGMFELSDYLFTKVFVNEMALFICHFYSIKQK